MLLLLVMKEGMEKILSRITPRASAIEILKGNMHNNTTKLCCNNKAMDKGRKFLCMMSL